MDINLLEHNNIEGRALSYLLEHKGFNVKCKSDLQTTSIRQSFKNDPSFLILNIDHLLANKDSSFFEFLNKQRHIILLGKLNQLHWLKKFPLNKTGFISKNNEAIYLLRVLKKINNHSILFGKKVKNFLNKPKHNKQKILFREKILSPLTETELNVLAEVGKGKTTRQIATERHKSVHTINNHRKNIIRKLKINGTYALLTFCIRHFDAIKTIIFLTKQKKKIQKILESGKY